LSLAFPRFVLTLTFLGYASIYDVKTREVPEKVWFVGVPTGLILTLLDVLAGVLTASDVPISLAVAFTVGFTLFYVGLYGRADAKALLFIAMTVPAHPEAFRPFLGWMLPIPVLTVFCNSLLLCLVYPATVSALNLIDVLKGSNPLGEVKVDTVLGKLVLMATTRRVGFEKLKGNVGYYPAERLIEKGRRFVRKPVYFVMAEADKKEIVKRLEAHKELYRNGVLASPTIPMIMFLTFGLALLPIGDLVLELVSLFLG